MDPILALPILIAAGGSLMISCHLSKSKIDNIGAARERANNRVQRKAFADTEPMLIPAVEKLEIDKLDLPEVKDKYLLIGDLTVEEKRIANTILADIDVSYIDYFDKPNSVFGRDNKIEEAPAWHTTR